jgi:hypothetical protein
MLPVETRSIMMVAEGNEYVAGLDIWNRKTKNTNILNVDYKCQTNMERSGDAAPLFSQDSGKCCKWS